MTAALAAPPVVPFAVPFARGRLLYLDVLRAGAILLVLGHHQFLSPAPGAWGAGFFAAWQRVGWVGVDLFFCLSGFLIGGLLFDEYDRTGGLGVGRFYARRAFKIWPAYLVLLGVAATVNAGEETGSLARNLPAALGHYWANFLHVQNYAGTRLPHTWSLAVEEHFYLLLPLLLSWQAAGSRGDARGAFGRLPLIGAAVAVACLAGRLHAARAFPGYDARRHVFPTHLRLDSLFAGVLLAYAVRFRRGAVERLRRRRLLLLAGGAACFVPAALRAHEATPALYTVGPLLHSLGSLLATLWAWFASTEPGGTGGRIVRALARVGGWSYSIYLWHHPFAWRLALAAWGAAVAPQRPVAHAVFMGLYVLSAAGLGWLSFVLVEKPALKLRDRFFPPKGSARGVKTQ